MKKEVSLKSEIKKLEQDFRAGFQSLRNLIDREELKELSIKDGDWVESVNMFLYRIVKEEDYIVKNLKRLEAAIPKRKRVTGKF